MAVDQRLLELLVCVQCKGALTLVEGGRGLLCESCQLKFPVRDDVPVMLMEEALDLKGSRLGATGRPAGAIPATGRKTGASAHFRVTAGPSAGQEFSIEPGSCKAIGRAINDPNKTTMFHVDVALALDEGTRNLIQQYVTQQFRRATPQLKEQELGFRRTGDIVINDSAVSRLHAMLFYDEVGVGILDLVSKNGTYVNGEEIESRLLQRGDTIDIGETKLVFEG
ncbi:MAG: FHA domain-containing protein [Deltaproteobacteria bacterium]|nr:FHA domain-containing protein [Deltaproteobacteria bacterium]